MFSKDVVFLGVVVFFSSVSAVSHSEKTDDPQHCGMVTDTNNTEEYLCVRCLFPQNCLSNNTCRTGSFGQTCEKCTRKTDLSAGYYRLGNICAECLGIHWSAVSFSVFVIIAILAVIICGFTESVCTKLKLIVHFMQYLLLCFHIKVSWPKVLVLMMSAFNFGCFNSSMINPECLFHWMHFEYVYYLEWLSSLFILTIMFITGKIIDNFMAGVNFKEKKHWGSTVLAKLLVKYKRTTLRRFLFFVLVIMYLPVTITGLHTHLCSDSVPVELVLDHSQDIFLMDNNIPCSNFWFQAISFFATIFIVVYVVFFPVLLVFVTLRQKKWNLLYAQWALYGPAYESYKDYFCFGEAVHLIRKLVSVVVTDAYPFKTSKWSSYNTPLSPVSLLGLSGLLVITEAVIIWRKSQKKKYPSKLRQFDKDC